MLRDKLHVSHNIAITQCDEVSMSSRSKIFTIQEESSQICMLHLFWMLNVDGQNSDQSIDVEDQNQGQTGRHRKARRFWIVNPRKIVMSTFMMPLKNLSGQCQVWMWSQTSGHQDIMYYKPHAIPKVTQLGFVIKSVAREKFELSTNSWALLQTAGPQSYRYCLSTNCWCDGCSVFADCACMLTVRLR